MSTRGWAGWDPVEVTVPCAGPRHRLRWERGSLVAVDHEDRDPSGECGAWCSIWQRWTDDPAALIVADGTPPDPAIGELLALDSRLASRLVAEIAITWADRLATDPALDVPENLVLAVRRRASEVLEDWWGDDIDIIVEPAADPAVLIDDGDRARLTVGVAWFAQVWCRGLALIGEDFFVLGVTEIADDRLVLDAVDVGVHDLEIDVALPLDPLVTSPPNQPVPRVRPRDVGGPVWVMRMYASTDYGQLQICTGDNEVWPDGVLPTDAAFRDATESRRFVGVADRALVNIIIPCEGRPWTPVDTEVWADEPPDDRDAWDHEVDLDLDVSEVIALAGCLTDWQVYRGVPSGRHRARISCGDYDRAAARTSGGRYRLRLWPRTTDSEPLLRRVWPEWERHRPHRQT